MPVCISSPGKPYVSSCIWSTVYGHHYGWTFFQNKNWSLNLTKENCNITPHSIVFCYFKHPSQIPQKSHFNSLIVVTELDFYMILQKGLAVFVIIVLRRYVYIFFAKPQSLLEFLCIFNCSFFYFLNVIAMEAFLFASLRRKSDSWWELFFLSKERHLSHN